VDHNRLGQLHIPGHRDRPFQGNVNADSSAT
jgi:hypothetical protein